MPSATIKPKRLLRRPIRRMDNGKKRTRRVRIYPGEIYCGFVIDYKKTHNIKNWEEASQSASLSYKLFQSKLLSYRQALEYKTEITLPNESRTPDLISHMRAMECDTIIPVKLANKNMTKLEFKNLLTLPCPYVRLSEKDKAQIFRISNKDGKRFTLVEIIDRNNFQKKINHEY